MGYILYSMRKADKQNAIVVATIVLCFMLTLGLCYLFSGEGFLNVFKKEEGGGSFYAVCSGSYDDIALARSNAEIIKARGGAGYVIAGERNEIVLAIYADRADAETVMEKSDLKGAYIKEISMAGTDLGWASKTEKEASEAALAYFPLAFDKLYNITSELFDQKLSLVDAITKIKVLRSQIEDIKTEFYEKCSSSDKAQLTEIKLALVTALALIDNIELDGTTAQAVSSARYQVVQLVLCRQALLSSIA